MALLEARGVNVVYEPRRGQRIWSVRDVDLTLAQGEFVGVVGESGCGKTTLGYALTRMLRPPARLESGVITFDGTDISGLTGERLRRQRRNGFALVLQSGMNTIKDLQRERGFTAILISHDLGTVLEATDRVMVMYAGRIVEDQPSAVMTRGQHHPYTEALLNCYGDPRAEVVRIGGIPGTPPDLSVPNTGCSFAPRCPVAEDSCLTADPPLAPLEPGRAACQVRARAGHVEVEASSVR